MKGRKDDILAGVCYVDSPNPPGRLELVLLPSFVREPSQYTGPHEIFKPDLTSYLDVLRYKSVKSRTAIYSPANISHRWGTEHGMYVCISERT